MAKKKVETNNVELIRRLEARLGTDIDGLVPVIKKFLKEKEDALEKMG